MSWGVAVTGTAQTSCDSLWSVHPLLHGCIETLVLCLLLAICVQYSSGSRKEIVQYNTRASVQVPKRYYFTRQVALGSHRNVIQQYCLPQRVYLGPTSMDTEMAFIMCNQAQVSCCPLSSFIYSSMLVPVFCMLLCLTLIYSSDVCNRLPSFAW